MSDNQINRRASPESVSTDRRLTAWETHFATIATAIIIAGLAFLGSQVWGTNSKLTELALTNKFLVETVNDLKGDLKDMANNYVTKSDFKDLDMRLRKVEEGRK